MRSEDRRTLEQYRPMLRVTVMMFKDMVESVTLLKEDAWSWITTKSDYDISQSQLFEYSAPL